jgi:hypothetical protein
VRNKTDPHAEGLHQRTVVQWAGYFPALKWLHSSLNGAMLNGTKIERAIQWKKLKAEGAKKGVLDLFLPVARNGYHGLYIEMKRADGKGRMTPEQKEFSEDQTNAGYLCVLCNGSDEAMAEIKTYMGM